MRTTFLLGILFYSFTSNAQFAPSVGQVGSTAVSKDSSIVRSWATGCTIHRGYMQINDPLLGYANVGNDNAPLNKADGQVVSLGDGGYATLTFEKPIANGSGPDFLVFENSFSDSFLELAFVEVSSDGIHFVRMPSVSLTGSNLQKGSFDLLEATKIHNLAGKYRGGYGVPFDLSDLVGISGIDLMKITHVRVIDVVGCIQPTYSTLDSKGNVINDPWPTPFASSGFDLDAVAVIHDQITVSVEHASTSAKPSFFPTVIDASTSMINLSGMNVTHVSVVDINGVENIVEVENNQINLNDFESGIYMLIVNENNLLLTQKIILQ